MYYTYRSVDQRTLLRNINSQFGIFVVPVRTVKVEERLWYGRRLLYKGYAQNYHQKYCLPTATQSTRLHKDVQTGYGAVILRSQVVSNLNEVLMCGFHSNRQSLISVTNAICLRTNKLLYSMDNIKLRLLNERLSFRVWCASST